MTTSQVTVTANKLDPVTQQYIPSGAVSSNSNTSATPSSSPAMNASNISPTTPIKIADPAVDGSSYKSKIDTTVADLTSALGTAKANVDTINTKGKQDSADIASLQELMGNKTADRNQAYNENGVTDAYNQLVDLNAEATGLKNEASAIPIQIQNESAGQGRTDAGVAPLTSARLRDNALKALSLGQQAAIASAKYDKAKNYADMIVDAKYEKIQASITAKLTNLQALKDFDLTPAQEKLRVAQEEKTKAEQAQLDNKKEVEKNINTILIELQKNNAPASVTQAVQNSGSVAEAITNSGTYLSSPETEVVKVGDDNAYLIDKRTGKIIKSFGGGSGGSGTGGSGLTGTGVGGIDLSKFNSVINFATNAESSVAGKKMVAQQMNNYIKTGNYDAAYNQVAQSVENSLTGSTKERFANARTDYQVMQGLRTMIQQYQESGGDMGLLKGNAETIERKLGQVSDPKLATIAVALQREFQTYRNVMTGAAFSPAESADYASVNPTTNKNLNLNLAVIDGALNQLQNRVDSTINARVPDARGLVDAVKATDPNQVLKKGDMSDRAFVEKVLTTKGLSGKYDQVYNGLLDKAKSEGYKQPMPVISNDSGMYGYIEYDDYLKNKSKYTPL